MEISRTARKNESTYIALMEIIFSTEAIKIFDRGESSVRKAMFPVNDSFEIPCVDEL